MHPYPPTTTATDTVLDHETARQLRDLDRQGGGMAALAHICAGVLLVAFSLGSLISLSLAAFLAVLDGLRRGTVDVPNAITVAVSVSLVLAMDIAMLYAATVLRVLNGVHASDAEKRGHVAIIVTASLLESATYLYMMWQFDRPPNAFLWLIGIGRALAAPIFATYLSMARALPVAPRDVEYQAALASGKGMMRDVAVLANDPTAPLARKVRIYRAASIMTPAEAERFQRIIDAVSEPDATPPNTRVQDDTRTRLNAAEQLPEPEPPTPSPAAQPQEGEMPAAQDADRPHAMRSNVRELPPRTPDPKRPKTVRADSGRTRVQRIDLRTRRENVAARILAAEPEISARDLARKIAIATKSRCSESTAHAIKDLLTMRASLNATLTPLTASNSSAEAEHA